jgi:hypothetical protein
MADVVKIPRRRRSASNPTTDFSEALKAAGLRGEIPRSRKPTSTTRVFAPSQPAPGVVPKGMPSMAMDSDINGATNWAADQLIAAYYADGITFLGYPLLAELAQRGEYRRLSEVIASEMTREWIEIKSSSDEDKATTINAIHDEIKRLGMQDAFRRLAEQDGFFGRAHLYIDLGTTDNPAELQTSIGYGRDLVSRAKVRKRGLHALRTVEAVWTYPMTYNANDPLRHDWYKPQSWFVMGKQIHATRLLTLVGREVPDLLKPAYMFGGLPLSQMAKTYIDKWTQTRDSVADLIRSFSTSVMLTDLTAMLNRGGQGIVENRADLYNFFRDNRGLLILNKDTEEFQNISTPLGGLDALQAQSQEHICSISGLPLIKYTGLTPSGLNASSEGEIRSFYDWIAAYQELLFREPMSRCLDFIQLSLFGAVDPDITFDFKSLWQLDEAGKASVQQTKADIHEKYEQLGAVSAEEIRRILSTDPDSPYAALSLDPDEMPEPPGGMPGEGGMPGMPGMPMPGMPGAQPPGGGGAPGGGGQPHGGSSVTSPFGTSRDPAAGKQSAGAISHRMGDMALDFEESKIKRDPGGKFSATGGGGGAKSEGGLASRAVAATRRGLRRFSRQDYDAIKSALPKGGEARKSWASHVAGIGKALPQLLKTHLKEEKENAIDAGGALKAMAQGNRPSPKQFKGLTRFGTRLLLSAASMALTGDPTGTVGHAAVALTQEIGQHVALEHFAKLGLGTARVFAGGGDATPNGPNGAETEVSPEDIELLQKYIEELMQALLDYEPEEPDDKEDDEE